MGNENDKLSKELDAMLQQAGVDSGQATPEEKSSAGEARTKKLESDLVKANSMLRDALEKKQLADSGRRSAVEKAETLKNYQVESVAKLRKKIDSLEERLANSEPGLESAIKERDEAVVARKRFEAEANRLKEEAMHAMHKANEEMARMQDELLLATAQSGAEASEIVEPVSAVDRQTADLEEMVEFIRIARSLESDLARPQVVEVENVDTRTRGRRLLERVVLFLLVGGLVAMYEFRDHSLINNLIQSINQIRIDIVLWLVQTLSSFI